MNATILLARNLRYHLRGNLAVLLGAAVGAAVLTGALLVGDSLRGSLRQRTERQLGPIDNVLISTRFLRQGLAAELSGTVHGAVMLQGSVHAGPLDAEQRAGKVTVWGVNRRFGLDRPQLDGDEPIAILSANLAKKLQVKEGDVVEVSVQKPSGMPRSSFLSKRGVSESTGTMRLTVKAILDDHDAANSLSLSISPSLPLNMFVPLARLQREIEQTGRVNALLATGQSAQSLQTELQAHLTLDDWGLQVEGRRTYISVESSRFLLDLSSVAATEKTAQEMGLRSAQTYTYLANSIAYGNKEIPYSIVAALDLAANAPLGPFLPAGVKELAAGDGQLPPIVLANWDESPIRVGPEDKDPRITLTYFKPEVESQMEQASAQFRYLGLVKMEGPADDRYLTPQFPGITDKTDIQSWNPPFEIDKRKIKSNDERYWKKYGTTPKAYIRLEDGQKLWGTRFGKATSVRIAPPPGANLEAVRADFAKRLLAGLDPAAGNLVFQPIRERMLAASAGSNDFGMLFLCFSFFLIVAALMLVALLFRLNLDRRASEIGLLRAAGFPLRKVRGLLLAEGLILAVAGSLLGIAGAFAYAAAMVRLLVNLWPTRGVESYLSLHATWLSVGAGFLAAVFMSGAAMLWSLRALMKVAPAELLKGATAPPIMIVSRYRPSPWPKRIIFVSVLCAAALAIAGPFSPPGEPQAMAFFGSGALLLTAGLALLWAWLKRTRHALVNGHGAAALLKLGSRNAVRNPVRSLLTAGLLASAAFLLVAVESFRREPEKDFLEKNGGSGGFPLLAEAGTPLDFDPNDAEGNAQIEDGLERHYQDRGILGPAQKKKVEQDMAALKDVSTFRFRVQPGDDASCLNLYQASRPRLIGVPHSIVERGGFSFSATLDHPDNPWLQLDEAPAGAIPCIVEQNTAMWMLKLGLGDTFEVRDEENRPLQLKIVAMLKDSVFQSQVLISDAAFRQYFPKTEGFAFFLIEAPPGKDKEATRVLTDALTSYGFETTPCRERVAEYLAVENTYLTTFQLLGGFGLLLGALGLSVVLLRGIWERRAELALMRALGYRKRSLNGLILAENGLLLVVGLAAGTLAALAAVAPHLAEGGHVPWARLSVMLGLVLVVGLTVAFIAVATTLRAPLIPALREE
jgi:putative ABC transport system permease protein